MRITLHHMRKNSESQFSADKRTTGWRIQQRREDRIRTAAMCKGTWHNLFNITAGCMTYVPITCKSVRVTSSRLPVRRLPQTFVLAIHNSTRTAAGTLECLQSPVGSCILSTCIDYGMPCRTESDIFIPTTSWGLTARYYIKECYIITSY